MKRTINSIYACARTLGLKRSKTTRKFWTSEELEYLKTIATKYKDRKYIYEQYNKNFPTRDNNVINHILNKLGFTLENNDWTTEEISLIKQYYPTLGRNIIKYLPNRSYDSINRKANTLGIHLDTRVICIETGIIYNSVTECSKSLNISTQNLSQGAIKGHKTCKGMHFAYLKDYNSNNWKPAPTYDSKRRALKSSRKKEVYCLQTNTWYNSVQEASKILGISNKYISRCAKGEIIQMHNYNFCYKENYYNDWKPRKSNQGKH